MAKELEVAMAQLAPSESGSVLIPRKMLEEAPRRALQEFERALLHQAHARALVVTVDRDWPADGYRVSWRPEGYPGSRGIYGLGRA